MQRRYIKKEVTHKIQTDKESKESMRESVQQHLGTGKHNLGVITQQEELEHYLYGYLDQIDVLGSEASIIFNINMSDEAMIEQYEDTLLSQKQGYLDYKGKEKTELPLNQLKQYLKGRVECIDYHLKVLESLKSDREYTQLTLF